MIGQNETINEIAKVHIFNSNYGIAYQLSCTFGIPRLSLLKHRIFSMHRHVVIPSSVVWIEENRIVPPTALFTI